jgi:hypothetical protein
MLHFGTPFNKKFYTANISANISAIDCEGIPSPPQKVHVQVCTFNKVSIAFRCLPYSDWLKKMIFRKLNGHYVYGKATYIHRELHTHACLFII